MQQKKILRYSKCCVPLDKSSIPRSSCMVNPLLLLSGAPLGLLLIGRKDPDYTARVFDAVHFETKGFGVFFQ